VTLTNAGNDFALGAILIMPVPVNTTFVALNQTVGPLFSLSVPALGDTSPPAQASILSFTAGASATFTFVVRVNPSVADNTTVTGTVTAATASVDPNLANNTATTTTTA